MMENDPRQTNSAFPLAPFPAHFEQAQERQTGNALAKDRIRVTRACDRCKRRKIRCTGTQPCEICSRLNACCAYAGPYRRGRRPRPTRRDVDTLTSNRQLPSIILQSIGGATEQPRELHLIDSDRPVPPMIAMEPASRASPELPQTDLQGHYIGPASGVSFLRRVQQRLYMSNHNPTNFTFGDTPLPNFDPATFCVMVSKEQTTQLVQKYFDFSVPIDRFFHRPTIETWLDEFHETMGAMADTSQAPARRAVLWTIFATAQGHFSDMKSTNDVKSVHYFLTADYHLSKEKGAACLASVQARLFQCFWLLSHSRMNHCWDLFGATVRIAIAMGLHRKRYPTPVNNDGLIELECRRRTFWSAYCLDSYLSIALGRPRMLHEEDIDQDLPCEMDTCESLNSDSYPPPEGYGFSPMLAPVAYYKLHRIVNVVLRDLYSIHPISTTRRCNLALEYAQKLKAWRSDVPRFVNEEFPGPLVPLFQRQKDVVNLFYWHTIILVHRPLLLAHLIRISCPSNRDNGVTTNEAQMKESVDECLLASLNIVGAVSKLIGSGHMYRSFWGTTYFGFSAAVILYVHSIHQLSSSTDIDQKYFTAAVRCQEHLSKMMSKGSLTTRYCVVLEELRMEYMRRTDRPLHLAQNDATIDGNSIPFLNQDESLTGISYDDTSDGNPFRIYGSSLADISSWAQFESLIVPGYGGFDTDCRSL